ncbi:aminoacyl-tRNA hydrolase [Desulfovibrio sp. OttesenSCG-928-O18]|nr:aminoacyl-tRNA hydrolase [Desulfovibrio sp. OttesenSCG-928-O18]
MDFGGLFLGLGNPGATYAGTRHNFGFMAVETLLEVCAQAGDVSPLSGGKKRYEAWKCRLPLPGKGSTTWIVAKPLTFMNKSGEAAVTLLQFYKIPLSRLVVAHDELDIPLGAMRFKLGGGAAGHNGIRSIAELTGSQEFYRLRLGIGKPAGFDVTSFVLGRFSDQERTTASEILPAAVDGFFRFCTGGLKEAQQFINGFTIAQD